MITINIASIPERQKYLQQTLISLFSNTTRPDRINVYLNNYDKVPAFLTHDIITVFRSQDEKVGDIGDNGKFYQVEKTEGYYFTCDDDIIYPRDYIAYQVKAIERYNRLTICGFHGTIFAKRYKSYYDGNTIFHFFNGLVKDERVHMLGTGTTAWHTDTINLLRRHFKPNMADLYLMLQSQKQQVPMICLTRRESYLKEQEGSQDNAIWKRHKDDEHLKVLNNRKLIIL